MVLKTTPKNHILFLLMAVAFYLIPYTGFTQTRVYASSATSFQADNVPQSYDQNMTTAAQVRANSGLALGIGAYSGHVELQFPSLLPANTTSYVKITTDDNLLPSLLGGNLGGLLADVLGAVLVGNQEFTVEAKNNTTTVLDGDSNVVADFAGDRLRIVINPLGEYLIAITPASPYNRIRLTNRVGASLIGLGTEKVLNVFDAYYVSAPANCGTPAFTNFTGSGITLDALQLGSAGVQNPQFAIDANTTNFSVLSLGVLGVGATIQQTVYFEGLSGATDQFSVRLRTTGTLLNLDIANNIRIMSYNGGTQVTNQTLSTLLALNLLNMQGGTITTIPINPGAPVDRIVVSFSSLVGASVAQNLDFFGVTRTVAPPTITAPPVGSSYFACVNSTASLVATTTLGNELRWYTTATGGTATTVASGVPYITAVLTTSTTFYVAAAKIGCPEESSRIAVPVTVTSVPTPTTNNAAQEFCGFNSPTIASLQVNEPGVTFYSASSAGTLLPPATLLTNNTIYYATLTDAVTGCESTTRLAITVTLTATCDVTLTLKAMLQGPLFNSAGGLMRDDLRVGGYIPLNQPYSSAINARFTHVGGGGAEVTTAPVLQTSGANAIVDWVFIELRDAATPQTVIRTVSALIQRDGDIVAANGGPLVVNLPLTFRISIKHRNHFGALYNQVLTATNQAATLDFTTLTNSDLFALSGYTGQHAMATVGSVRALYTGNANFDGQVKYDGFANDRQVSASQVLSFPGNASQILNYANATGYFSGDVNMDGKVLYDGANNDRQVLLNIIVTYSLNTNTLSNYNGMSEQVPQ